MKRSPRFLALILVAILAFGFQSIHAQKPVFTEGTGQVKAGPFDTGKMWTFDFPPIDYFKKTYPGFNPDKEWFDKARLGAVRLQGCSGSFVSEDGLVMTNHHCARGAIDRIMKEGEDLHKSGFYAVTLADERKIPNTYVDQLIEIKDISDEIIAAYKEGTTPEEGIKKRTEKIQEIQNKSTPDIRYQVVTFYNGGRYSLYTFKRYNDVRMVYAPEEQLGFFGGDPDNFTYPRYAYDVTFYRVYENDKPLKTANFFKYNLNGAADGEVIFVIGNPGSTQRLFTYSQLEFFRDYQYPTTLFLLNTTLESLRDYVKANPEEELKMNTQIFGISNSQKLFTGMVKGLNDPILMGKKKDFENNFKQAVMSKPEQAKKYATLWDDLEKIQMEKARLFPFFMATQMAGLGRSRYFALASALTDYASETQKPNDQRPARYQDEKLDSLRGTLFPADLKPTLELANLGNQLTLMRTMLGSSFAPLNELLGGQAPRDAALRLVNGSSLTSKENVANLVAQGSAAILSGSDPFIKAHIAIKDTAQKVRLQYRAISDREQAVVQQLGLAMYDVFGTTIPPDATFTLRIADGVQKGYEYNGTIAPSTTTFYGMYDRNSSFGQNSDWKLPERWLKYPADFNLGAKLNLVGTNDIIGGNSGSPVINKNHEIVGLVFDGNIESLPSNIIYQPEKFRMVAVHPQGIHEGLRAIVKADRLVKELEEGKIVEIKKPASPRPAPKKR